VSVFNESSTFLQRCVAVAVQLSNPAGVVFDESHFGGFVEEYLRGTYFFDIHPPLGKLTMSLYAYLRGYKGGVCDYESNTMYAPECKYYILREITSFFGSFVPILVYGIAREVGCSRLTATFSALLLIVDVLNVMEARCILTDSQVMFYCALCLYVGLRWFRRLNESEERPLSSGMRWLWAFGVGMACGASISVKWTGLAYPGMIGVEGLFGIWFLKRPVRFVELLFVGVVAIVQYHVWWWFHFWALPIDSGASYDMPIEFQRNLIGNKNYDAAWPSFPFLSTTWTLNYQMLTKSASISSEHKWASTYPQWVTNARGLLYYGEPFGPQPGLWSAMYLIGNPIIVWGCGIGIIIFLLSALLFQRYKTFESCWDRRCRRSETLKVCWYAPVSGPCTFLGICGSLLCLFAVIPAQVPVCGLARQPAPVCWCETPGVRVPLHASVAVC
jgi:dolichyl-phosphate-mannose--protein O-mannosyl transferase